MKKQIVKNHIIILLFSLYLGLDLKAQVIIIPTITPQPTANINPCYNMGFESTPVGSYSALPSWTIGTGSYTNFSYNGYCLEYPLNNPTIPVASVADFPNSINCGTVQILASPFSGNKALYLGSNAIGYGFIRAEKSFSVTPGNPFLEYAYSVCVAHSHASCCDASYISIKLLDNLGNAISCGSVGINGINGTGTACINVPSIPTVTSSIYIWTPNWVTNTFDLSAYMGTTVKLKIEAGGCLAGGHHSQIWFDAQCMESVIRSNGVVNGNTITVCNSANIATLTSNAANSCTWNGPPTSTITNINSSSISTSVSGVYSVSIFNPNCASTNTFTYLMNFCNVSTSIKDNEGLERVLIYPNPSSGNISIKGNKEMKLSLVDFSGREIERFTISNSNGYTKNVSELPNGIYFILGNGVKEKIVVLHP